MIKSIKDSFNYREKLIYTSAINNCTEFVTARFSEVEEEVFKKYVVFNRCADWQCGSREEE